MVKNVMEIVYFYENFFRFKKKFLPLLIYHVGFFRSIFSPIPGDVFYLSSLANNMQLY